MTLKKDVLAVIVITNSHKKLNWYHLSFIHNRMQIWSLDFTIHSTKHGGNTLQVSDGFFLVIRESKGELAKSCEILHRSSLKLEGY